MRTASPLQRRAGVRGHSRLWDLVIAEAYASMPKLAEIMVAMGCQDAVNFDGGGSVNLYVDGYWLYGPQSRLLNNMLVLYPVRLGREQMKRQPPTAAAVFHMARW